MPDLVLSVDEIVVDDWNLVIADRFKFLGRMHRQGLVRGPMDREADVSEHKTVTEFGDILEGTAKWRRRRDTRVLFNPFGMAIEDIGIAGKVFESAKSRAIGTWLDR